MGARSKSMLARQPAAKVWSLLAPGSLETLESHRDQRLGGVFPVSRLRPGDDERAGRQGERFVKTKPDAFVPRPHAEVRIQKHSATLLGTRAVRPILRIRWHKVTAVLSQVEARFGLDEVFDVDHAEALTVVQELVVFVVAVRRDR